MHTGQSDSLFMMQRDQTQVYSKKLPELFEI